MRVLMVCLGNICRSPLAEGILKDKATINDLPLDVDSAGTSSFHIGEHPDPRSIQKAKDYNISIHHQRARQFTINDFDKFDQIYVMDTSNYKNVIDLARDDYDKQKVKLILDETYPNQKMSVPDPYYGGDDGFENVYQLLDAACDKIIENIKITK